MPQAVPGDSFRAQLMSCLRGQLAVGLQLDIEVMYIYVAVVPDGYFVDDRIAVTSVVRDILTLTVLICLLYTSPSPRDS